MVKGYKLQNRPRIKRVTISVEERAGHIDLQQAATDRESITLLRPNMTN